MSSKELAPYLQEALRADPKLDQRNWIKDYGFYVLEVSLDAKFTGNELMKLRVSWSETY